MKRAPQIGATCRAAQRRLFDGFDHAAAAALHEGHPQYPGDRRSDFRGLVETAPREPTAVQRDRHNDVGRDQRSADSRGPQAQAQQFPERQRALGSRLELGPGDEPVDRILVNERRSDAIGAIDPDRTEGAAGALAVRGQRRPAQFACPSYPGEVATACNANIARTGRQTA